jgi:predicted N-formylglutamate amidohydrolase
MPADSSAVHDAYETAGDPSAGGPFVFTCEHATNELPEWQPEPADLPLLADHWGWDIGAADLARALAGLTGSCAVLSRFSRLVCDPNRDPAEPSFVVEEILGRRLVWNRGVDAAERRRRERRYFDPYHAAIDRTLHARRALGTEVRLCAVHSFTPVYLGQARPMEVGVLFDAFDEHAWRVEGALAAEGFAAALNAPYSGQDGLIYSARRHGRAHGLVYLELEVRQDLIDTGPKARSVAARIARALEVFAPAGAQGSRRPSDC